MLSLSAGSHRDKGFCPVYGPIIQERTSRVNDATFDVRFLFILWATWNEFGQQHILQDLTAIIAFWY
jgi:hypothetical protein